MASILMLCVRIVVDCFRIVLYCLSIIFCIAKITRLTLPLLYVLAMTVSTLFTDWVSQHETPILIGLYVLIGLVVLSWIVSLVKFITKQIYKKRRERFSEEVAVCQIRRARELGLPLDVVAFDENGFLINPRTGKPIECDDNEEPC